MSAKAENSNGLIAWFAGNSVAANLLMAALLIGGLFVISDTNSEVFPQIDPRTVSVSVPYPGATSDEVEDSITRRVDAAVLGLEGIDRVNSSASEGAGSITIELNDFADAQEVKDDVQSAIDQLSDFPPEDADTPEVTVTTTVSSVLRLVVVGDVGERALRLAAEDLEQALIATDGVSVVTLQGVRDYEMSIEVPQATLRQYDLDIGQVANAIRESSVNVSAGTIRTPSGDVLLRTTTEARSAQEYGRIVILSDFEGRRVLLRDIATIRDGFADEGLVNTYNNLPAVFLQVDRSGDEDAFEVSGSVKALLETYTPPPGISVLISSDATETINDRINLLVRNGLLGLALVFVFLALTLDLKLAFWASVGIPTAFLGGFIIFTEFTTINMITLFGLIMVLGIVVDDAIVVGENIYEKQSSEGHGENAAIEGARGVLVPVMIGITTSIMVFSPLLWSSGMLGQILRPVPMVVIAVLLVSLVEVFLILPAHLAHGGAWSMGPMLKLKALVETGLFWVRDRLVMPIVEGGMRMPWVVIAGCVASFIAFVGLFSGGHVRFIFFPVVEGEEVVVSLEMPAGTPFEQTEATMNQIVRAGYEAMGGEGSLLYESMSVTIGGTLNSGFGASGTVLQSERASATLELAPAGNRDVSAAEIERRWRDAAGTIAGIKALTFTSAGLTGGDDISFDLTHPDSDRLAQAVERLTDELSSTDGVSEIETSAEPGKRQINFRLTEPGVAAGLTENDLAQALRQSYFGEEVERFQRGSQEVEVYVRFPEDERRSLAELATLRVSVPTGGDVALTTIAAVEETRSDATINRVDGRRIISVTADVEEAVTTPTAVNTLIEETVLTNLVAAFPGLVVSTEGQARDQAEDMTTLATNLLYAVLAMYCLLASVLRSYVQPLIILAIIPFGLVGAVVGHMLLGYDLSFLSLFGVVALSGVIVNDSIVLIDYFNSLQAQRSDKMRNIAEAVRRRFRPILLTTLTTFIGLVPMISETSIQAQFLIPMALSIAFGMLFACLLILILVPACLVIATWESGTLERESDTVDVATNGAV